ncbi:MAG: putative GTP-binding protein EngB [Candidatus Nomurabacteria bacterium GW2011_GWE1_32_28]|uniref:Probable GTP-binding protein EngB n=1 Tax=Candidatus Nomurabacteria bacterium GW2011_GWF1_31_48 TaxID=1618767 RepID=A0A0G0BFW8_9BACT|nr:MAG: putative GTP-binding protein EngB [Candidatus Nomurabacteria bacterium GW2011_GWF2_30_133]KKP28382.1 MAG: putative GTP-binding protein EngB [Candidatus Nomurabacteria bacterium GW2011_GWE2_31_40]KKP29967.1 MAG: putative GTP-binding protein EngB [Candidatus Nomurabacteria bacterium GW2011_GWF1_31_48]KKP35106.1 MAG: putative GTP-binding protein EngB [Candidatus Nomurabacteria bacterium GW2011_GWE1_32_28]HAS80918.1 ribosome biogenesis GTP-binding protein YsxC [Candidatus Nomurabacteria bac
MKIISAKFIKGVIGEDKVFTDGIPQIAFLGRSNVGKSSLINGLTHSSISRKSAFPGSTQEINIFLINKSIYFVDLPGYGFTRVSGIGKEKIGNLITEYIFNPNFNQKKILLIIDAKTGMTEQDIEVFEELEKHEKDFIIILNKIDKINQSDFHHRLVETKKFAGEYLVFPCSSKTKKGLDPILNYILKK